MYVGSAEDVKRYLKDYGRHHVYTSQEDFYDSFKHPLWKYTGGGDSQSDYGVNIIDKYQFDYLPAQPVSIFP
jgi:hypothetical protein